MRWSDHAKLLQYAMTLPERVERALEHQRARNIVIGIYDGNATAAGMNRLLEGNAKDTVK